MLKLEPRAASSRVMGYGSPLLALALTLITGYVLFALLGKDPVESLYTFFIAPLADLYGWSELGVKVTPILLCALGLAVCYRANVWNIGAEGQLIAGALLGSMIALQLLDIEGWWVLPTVLLSGVMGGLMWGGVAAWLKTRFAANEILTTIMLNYIALNLLLYGIHGPLKDPQGYNFPESALFTDSALLPVWLEGTRLHVGLAFALLLMAVIWVLLSRTLLGFQVKVVGADASAGRYAGFKSQRLIWFCLLLSGALAGLAGVVEVAGPIGQLVPVVSPGYGYSAIIVAFLGRLHPLGIVLASTLMGLIYLGGELAQISLGLPLALTGVFQGLLLFYLLICDVLIHFRVRWQRGA